MKSNVVAQYTSDSPGFQFKFSKFKLECSLHFWDVIRSNLKSVSLLRFFLESRSMVIVSRTFDELVHTVFCIFFYNVLNLYVKKMCIYVKSLIYQTQNSEKVAVRYILTTCGFIIC